MGSLDWSAAMRHSLDSKGFKFQTVLHQGARTDVYECIKPFRKVHCAVKAPEKGFFNRRELAIMKQITQCKLDKYNLVKCYGDIQMFSNEKMLVLEKLDINLEKYIVDSQCKPLALSCVRDVAKQMNVALMALRRQSIIHADIKPSNIMIVKQSQTPLQFKLIDFGSALWTREATEGITPGTVGYMSPEIMLGLPFTQSTDVWSLGCVLACMFLGHSLLDTQSEFDTFKAIHELISQPSDKLLDKGMYTSRFYNKIDGKWVLKSAEKTEEKMFSSLDDLKPLSNRHDAIEREQFVELLKKMLQVNPEDRITPEEIMKHPFISGPSPCKVSKWKRFTPFLKRKETSQLQSENQPSQHPANAVPSEKPKVFNVQPAKNIFSIFKRNNIYPQGPQNQHSQRPANAVSSEKPKAFNAESVFTNLKRNKIHPFSEGQTMCAKTKPEPKTQAHKFNPDLSPGRPGVSRVQPASEITEKGIPRNKCPKTNSFTVSAKQKKNQIVAKNSESLFKPTEPSLPKIIVVKPASQENRALPDWDMAKVTVVTRNSTNSEFNCPVGNVSNSNSIQNKWSTHNRERKARLTDDNLRDVCTTETKGLHKAVHVQRLEFSEVEILSLGCRDIVRIENLWRFERLSTLHLNNNHIQKMEGLSSLTNLICLNLSFNNISQIEGLDSLKKLEQLNLCNNKISLLENMDALENLGLFDIANNNLNDLNQVMHLRKWRNILTLNLLGNPLSEEDDYKLFVIALLPNLKYLDNRYVKPAFIKEALDKFDSEVLQLNYEDVERKKKAEALKTQQAELQLHEDAFVEALNGSFLFEHMLKDDPHANHLQSVPEIAEQQESFKQKMTELCVQLFETGLLELKQRTAEVNSFRSNHRISKEETLKKETQLMEDFKTYFNYSRQLMNDSESTSQTKPSLKDELKKLHNHLLTLEFKLRGQIEIMTNKLDVEITEMIGAFIKTANEIFAQCQDLEDKYHEKVQSIVSATIDNMSKDLGVEDLSEDVKRLFSEKETVMEVLTTAHANHLITIQDRETQLIARTTAWKGELIKKLREEDLYRSRSTQADFIMFVEHYEEELHHFRGSEEH